MEDAEPVIPGATPARSDDTGEPDPLLADALASGDAAAALARVLLARLLVPVAATGEPDAGGAEKSAEMAVPALLEPSGARALPAFSGLAALRRWQPGARPVPMPGARVVAGAVAEGYDAVVLDVAGPHPLQLTGPVLTRLAAAAERLLAGDAAGVSIVQADDGNPDRC